MSVSSVHIQTDRTMALAAYILHLIGSVTGVLSIGALILNYFRRSDYADALASHHRYMIRTFWWTVLWFVIGWCLHFLFIGWVFWVAAWCWYVYRHIRGLVALANGEGMPA
ncbi:MAG TPA: hypothetical protein VMS45_04580 [Gemmatimonadaceae bacterium]|jgi:uncharacterized membrane protein|nr:hypothetical protein [Gemmatimonadaceae bacterium]